MTISYNRDIPDGPNNPSNDQPKMKTNTNSIDDWTAVDHIKFENSPAGAHRQARFPFYTDPIILNGTATQGSAMYGGTIAGAVGMASADPDHAIALFKQPNATFIMSAIRAFGSFTLTAGTTAFLNSSNCASLAVSGSFVVTITLVPNSVTSTSYIVIPFYPSVVSASGYSITKVNNVITISLSAILPNLEFSFIVLQN